jgi:excisionase family DNA binding protein
MAIADSSPAELSPADLLAEDDAAEVLGVSPGTLQVWRSTKRYGLPYLKIGRLVRYRRADLLAWLESRLVGAAV